MRVLIANRGEIASRIERTCVGLGYEVVPIVVEGDAFAAQSVDAAYEFVPSYLDAAAIVEVGVRAGCTAVHPGFGFLAENAAFAQAVIDAGMIWIGPRPDVIEQMGSKINARSLAEAAQLTLIPGYAESQDDDALAAAAGEIGFPVLVKASAGGGGKGIRIARSADEFAPALTEARLEARRSFGDDSVIVERYVERPRHVEVQVIGDRHGNVYHLGTRECSVQRRYQKLFEEAPAPNLPDATRAGLHQAAVALAKSVNYDSAGTVEFIVDDETGDFYFLEMNTRLQVEHPVTEEITGLDLVALMLDVAGNAPLPDLSRVEFSGHALEARITAEDAGAGFVPSVGEITVLDVPDDVRWDGGGYTVTTDYDAMIAKMIVHGRDRAHALTKMRSALDELLIGGLRTITGFHRWLVDQPEVVEGRVTTRFLDERELPANPEPDLAGVGSALWNLNLNAGADSSGKIGLWSGLRNFSLTPRKPTCAFGVRDLDGNVHEIPWQEDVDSTYRFWDVQTRPRVGQAYENPQLAVNVDGHTQSFEVLTRSELWAPMTGDRAGTGNALVAPFPAAVAEVHVATGDAVVGEQVLIVIEAMKMLHSLKADGAAIVDDVLVAVGDQVSSNQALVTFATPSESAEAP